jgi:hypothetical protein
MNSIDKTVTVPFDLLDDLNDQLQEDLKANTIILDLGLCERGPGKQQPREFCNVTISWKDGGGKLMVPYPVIRSSPQNILRTVVFIKPLHKPISSADQDLLDDFHESLFRAVLWYGARQKSLEKSQD